MRRSSRLAPFLLLAASPFGHTAQQEIGAAYCAPATPNSTGLAGRLLAFGSRALVDNDLTLAALDLPPGAATVFVVGDARAQVPSPVGSLGTLCVGGSIGRILAPTGGPLVAGSGGAVVRSVDLDNIPQPTGLVAVGLGEAWHFQAWFRDSSPAGATTNWSEACEVRFGRPIGVGPFTARELSEVAFAETVRVADFDGDGLADLLTIADTGLSFIPPTEAHLQLGLGGGEFAPPTTSTLAVVVDALEIGDIDGDGRLDLGIATAGSDDVFLGRPDGTFVPAASFAGGIDGRGLHVALDDLDGDGDLDAYFGRRSLRVVENLGGGAFAAHPSVFGPPTTRAHGIADANGDGLPDVLVAYSGPTSLGVRLNLGSLDFGLETTLVGNGVERLELGDYDGDGHVDAALGGLNGIGLRLRLGDGAGGFGPELNVPGAPDHDSLHSADTDADGDPDLVLSGALALTTLVNGGSGTFVAESVATDAVYPSFVGTAPFEVASLADVDGDGRLEALSERGLALAGLPGGGFAAPLGALPSGSVTVGATAAADFDGDGLGDVAVIDHTARAVLVLRAAGAPGAVTYPTSTALTSQWDPFDVAAADVDGDGLVDLVTANRANSVSLHFNDGAGGFLPEMRLAASGGAQRVELGDVDGDGHLDIVTGGSASADLLRGLGARTFEPARPLPALPAWGTTFVPALGDLDRDGRDEILVTTNASSTLARIEYTAAGALVRTEVYTLANAWLRTLGVADVNGDGWPDVVGATFTTSSPPQPEDGLLVLEAQGSLLSARAVYVQGPAGARGMTTRDVDADGVEDVLVSLQGASVLVFGDPAGRYERQRRMTLFTLHPTLADVDADGRVDLIGSSPSVHAGAALLRVFFGL